MCDFQYRHIEQLLEIHTYCVQHIGYIHWTQLHKMYGRLIQNVAYRGVNFKYGCLRHDPLQTACLGRSRNNRLIVHHYFISGLTIETIETLLPLLCIAMQQSTTLYNKPNTTPTNTTTSTTTIPRSNPATPSRQGATAAAALDATHRREEQPNIFGDVSMLEDSLGSGRLEESRIVDVEEPANKDKQSVSYDPRNSFGECGLSTANVSLWQGNHLGH